MDYTINVHGRLIDLSEPQVMGILNVTPDSFYAGSRKQTEQEIAERANQIVEQGATMIDIGGYSTRPGAGEVSECDEMDRLRFALDIVRRELPFQSSLLIPFVLMLHVWQLRNLALISLMT